MLTDNKGITKPEYWDSLYQGKRQNAPVDSSNGKRVSTFDRFTIVADLVEGPDVLEVAAGHARIASMVKAKHPKWDVWASDQSTGGSEVSKFTPYAIMNVYDLWMYAGKNVNTIIATQCFEYFEDIPKALTEFKRVAKKGVFTFPNGNMSNWSQLYIFTPELVKELLTPYGTIEVFEVYDHLILVKIKFL